MTWQAMDGAATLIMANFRTRLLVAHRIHHPRGLESQQAGLLYENATPRNPLESHGPLGHRLSERRAHLRHAGTCAQHALREADQAHAMMNPSRPEAALGDLKSAAFTQQNVGDGYPYVLKNHLSRPVGHAVETHHRQRPQHADPGVSVGTRIIDC